MENENNCLIVLEDSDNPMSPSQFNALKKAGFDIFKHKPPLALFKYAVEQRMRFIDFLLHQYGHINRSALEDFFGISTPQATKDIAMYMEIAPDNMRYSIKKRVYLKNPEFERVWF